MSFDPVSRELLRQIYPDIATRVIRTEQDMLRIHQRQIKVTQAIRTMKHQQSLYAMGRKLIDGSWVVVDRKLVVTNSPPGFSMHHFGLAVDGAFAGPDPYLEKLSREERDFLWKEYGRISQAHGLQWGGDWNGNGLVDANDFDRPHVQCVYGLRLQDIRELYKSGGIDAVWSMTDKLRGVPEGLEWKTQTIRIAAGNCPDYGAASALC